MTEIKAVGTKAAQKHAEPQRRAPLDVGVVLTLTPLHKVARAQTQHVPIDHAHRLVLGDARRRAAVVEHVAASARRVAVHACKGSLLSRAWPVIARGLHVIAAFVLHARQQIAVLAFVSASKSALALRALLSDARRTQTRTLHGTSSCTLHVAWFLVPNTHWQSKAQFIMAGGKISHWRSSVQTAYARRNQQTKKTKSNKRDRQNPSKTWFLRDSGLRQNKSIFLFWFACLFGLPRHTCVATLCLRRVCRVTAVFRQFVTVLTAAAICNFRKWRSENWASTLQQRCEVHQRVVCIRCVHAHGVSCRRRTRTPDLQMSRIRV